MADFATFTAPHGGDPTTQIRQELHALVTPTVGDLLYVGQVFRSRIRTRTLRGVDVNGAPFAPYSTKGPYYFYPNKEAGAARGSKATDATKKARATAARGRHAKTDKQGTRTPYGIRYGSYAAAKAAHGVTSVNLYGMEQHTHMLDTMLVRAGGSEVSQGDMDFGSDLAAFEGNQPCYEMTIGFYGPEAERAKGQNEGNSKTPQREFFALNSDDLRIGEQAIGQRMMIRAQANAGSSQPHSVASRAMGPITDEDVPI